VAYRGTRPAGRAGRINHDATSATLFGLLFVLLTDPAVFGQLGALVAPDPRTECEATSSRRARPVNTAPP